MTTSSDGPATPSPDLPVAVPAVILAGGRLSSELSAVVSAPSRALIPVSGELLLARVHGALRQSSAVDGIVVVGNAETLEAARSLGSRATPEGEDLVDNLLRGMEAAGGEQVLVSAGDLPLLTPEAVDEFVSSGQATGADVVYPIVPRETMDACMPGARRTYVRMSDGVYTGGNMFLLRCDAIKSQQDLIRSTYEARKHPLRLCRMLGWGFLLRLMMRRLSVAATAGRIETMLGCACAAVICQHPEIGIDIDKPADLRDVERLLATGMASVR